MVREFVSQDETKLQVKAVGADHTATLDRSDIHSVSVIVGSQKGRFAM